MELEDLPDTRNQELWGQHRDQGPPAIPASPPLSMGTIPAWAPAVPGPDKVGILCLAPQRGTAGNATLEILTH